MARPSVDGCTMHACSWADNRPQKLCEQQGLKAIIWLFKEGFSNLCSRRPRCYDIAAFAKPPVESLGGRTASLVASRTLAFKAEA